MWFFFAGKNACALAFGQIRVIILNVPFKHSRFCQKDKPHSVFS